jgi:1,4-dihydroxy-2-naphthoate octaprenyltransferase
MRLGYRHLNTIGSVLLLTALVLIFVRGTTTIVPLVLLVASLIIFVILILHRKQLREETLPDERTRKIGSTALSYAWWTGICGIILLFWADALGLWRPDTQTALGVSILLMFGSAVIFLVYLSSKGDTDG